MPENASIRLSELTAAIRDAISFSFEGKFFWVVADITNHNFKHANNWHFFTLVEKQAGGGEIIAKAEAVAWKPGALKIQQFESVTGQPFQNNISVLARVSVEYSSQHGLKLVLHDIDPGFTLGALEKRKQDILARLLAECSEFISKIGDEYITRNSRLKLRPVIQRIALIASAGTAGYEDFMHTLENNNYGYKFHVDNYFTAMQGQNNSPLIRQKLIDIFNSKIDYDAVVIIRGGGAQTDFLIFDDYELGKAVAKLPIPIITGIGHHRNETIVDLLAHSPTNAPTKAAETIIARNRAFEEQVLRTRQSIVIRSQQLFASNTRELSSLQSSVINHTRDILATLKGLVTRSHQALINTTATVIYKRRAALSDISNQILLKPRTTLSNKQNDLRNLAANFKNYSRMFLEKQKGTLAHFETVVTLMNPANLLKKGFAIVRHEGKIVINADPIKQGDDITVTLADTDIHATVKTKSNGKRTNL